MDVADEAARHGRVAGPVVHPQARFTGLSSTATMTSVMTKRPTFLATARRMSTGCNVPKQLHGAMP